MIKVTCKQCKSDFLTKPSRIKDGRGKFCSRKCFSIAQRTIPKYRKTISKMAKIRKGSKDTEETRNKKIISRRAYLNQFIGNIITSKKYNLVYDPYHFNHEYGNYIPQHRYVVEKILNRNLLSSEPVHHINGNKKDNRIQNLIVLNSNSAHKRMDWGKKVLKKEIVFDGRKYKCQHPNP